MAHANTHNAYLVGGNTAMFLPGGSLVCGGYRDPNEMNVDILKRMADAAGYRLVKKSKKKVNFNDGSVMPTPEEFHKRN